MLTYEKKKDRFALVGLGGHISYITKDQVLRLIREASSALVDRGRAVPLDLTAERKATTDPGEPTGDAESDAAGELEQALK